MAYSVEKISINRKERLVKRYGSQVLYEVKSDVYGCCIKLLTGIQPVRNRWEENFYFASQSIRSHGRLYVVLDPSEGENKVYYDPYSKTAFLLNIDYYGWIKSLALSLAGDILEDEHNIYSVHGACLDVQGKGMCLLGGSGAGKTTHTYGLLRNRDVRVVSDDWFYARIFGDDILAYGSEKNFYIRADLATIWKKFEGLVAQAEFDNKGRAVVDLRQVIGKGRILPLTTMQTMIILKRDLDDNRAWKKLDAAEALKLLEDNNYFNPHLLIKNPFKQRLRNAFFKALLDGTMAYEVNTTGTPEESQKIIRDLVALNERPY
jgi:hypothetical protein